MPQNQTLFQSILRTFASLKLTVTLLVLTIILVFIGTLAQWRKDVNQAVGEYFRTPIAWVEPGDLVPVSFFPEKSKAVEAWEKNHLETTHSRFYIPYPGGMTLGILVGLNLLAAHGSTFRLQSRGKTLLAGVALLSLGLVLTVWVINHSQTSSTPLAESPDYHTLWTGIKIGCFLVWLGSAAWIMKSAQGFNQANILIGIGGLVSLGLFCWLFILGEAPVNDNSSRILWQMIQGGGASLVLYAGCVLLFKKRASVVLLHSGLLLMLANEMIVYLLHTEWHMEIPEHGSNYVTFNLNKIELAFERPLADKPDEFEVLRVPESRLQAAYAKRARLKDAQLPCDIEIVEWWANSDVRPFGAKNANQPKVKTRSSPEEPWTENQIVALPPVSGTSGGDVNQPAAHVVLYERNTDNRLGEFLLTCLQGNRQLASLEKAGKTDLLREDTTEFEQQKIATTGGDYEVTLRFAKTYKPYALHALEVRGDNYLGSTTPRNYSTQVELLDATGNIERAKTISMNNPLRHNGETFYQSSYSKNALTGIKKTTLQVVANTGWMIPYVGCMIVMTGMLFHFWNTLTRFLSRNESWEKLATASAKPLVQASPEAVIVIKAENRVRFWTKLTVAGSVLAFAITIFQAAMLSTPADDQFDLPSFGKLPVIFKGRMKCFDTVARNALNSISLRETVNDDVSVPGKSTRLPAVRWLIEVYAHELRPPQDEKSTASQVENYRIFYIENKELVDELQLPWDKAHDDHLYSVADMRGKIGQLKGLMEGTKGKSVREYTVIEKKTRELLIRTRVYEALSSGTKLFDEFDIDRLPAGLATEVAVDAVLLQKFNELQEYSLSTPQFIPYYLPQQWGEELTKNLLKRLESIALTFKLINNETSDVAPTELFEQEMLPFSTSFFLESLRLRVLASTSEDRINPFVQKFGQMLIAYADGKPAEFNKSLHEYQELLKTHEFQTVKYRPEVLATEYWFNHWNPFVWLMAFYLIGAVLALAAWLFSPWQWDRFLQPTAFWLVVSIAVVHVFALGVRVYLSGRPPVTNLYSSALFIGCGAVILALIIERLTRLSIGTLAAGIMGWGTLVISRGLYSDILSWAATGGDTMGVMLAVLDTNFWLATHVVTVALGYATTFLAGVLGMLLLTCSIVTPLISAQQEKQISKMIYGVTCFSIFFSFVGTVLGGLWADDSWGRFWGWDPKENGAFMIVLWNAVVLHANWGKMSGPRGMAALATFGSVVTAWSYFGTNELGVGLHSYGFTEGILQKLLEFATLAVTIIAVSYLIPYKSWWSVRRRKVL